MAKAASTNNRVYLYRLLTLNIDHGTAIVRNLIDDKCSYTQLTTLLANERTTITNLRAKGVITKDQYERFYPRSGKSPTTADLDLTLAICLLRNLKYFGLNSKYNCNVTPQSSDTSLEADLCRLWTHRKDLAHMSSTQDIRDTDYQAKWADIEGVLHRLNNLVRNPIQNLQQIIDECKSCPLDPEAEIDTRIEKMQILEDKIEVHMKDIKADLSDVLKYVKKVEKPGENKEAEGTQIKIIGEIPAFFQRTNGKQTKVGGASYRMLSKPRGLCVIINNCKFRDPGKNRDGTNKDAERLKAVFRRFHFEVEEHPDMEGDAIKEKLKEYAMMDHLKYDCFICCILSHGASNDMIQGVDGKFVSLKELMEVFKATKCQSLAGKPKLFFVQTCKGDRDMKAYRVQKDDDGHNKEPAKTKEEGDFIYIPEEADFLLGYSTCEGYASFRDGGYGSYYIQALCHVLEDSKPSYGIVEQLVEVNALVAKVNIPYEDSIVKQMPTFVVTLTKCLFLE